MTQGAYKLYPDAGIVGQEAATGGISDITSIVNGSTPIPFGRVVSYDSTGKLALGGTANFAGVALDCSVVPGATGDEFPASTLVPVLKTGRVYMRLVTGSSAVVPGGNVFVVSATGEVRGNAVATGNGSTTALTNAVFEDAGEAGSIVTVRLDTQKGYKL